MVVVVLGVVAGAAGQSKANLVINGDFETGNLSGWTKFTTANGSTGIGLPNVLPFNVNGSETSKAARFEVGEVTYSGLYQGGGLSQDFLFGGGTLDLSADVAAQGNGGTNASGGRFELLLNNVVLSTFQVDSISGTAPVRGQLSARQTGLAAGSYTLGIRITRPFRNGSAPGQTPYQFVDNVTAVNATVVAAAVVPEPSTVAGGLLGTGLTGFWWAWRRKRRVA